MGLFGNLFGAKDPGYPALDPAAPAAAQLDNVRPVLETLAEKVNQPLEIIPASEGAFVYIGKPPKKFGLAWVEDGTLKNFKTLTDEHGVTPKELNSINIKLQTAYERHQDQPRYTAEIAGQNMVVIPSANFEQDIKEIIKLATN